MKTTGSFHDLSLQMLTEMNDKAKRLVKLMKQGIVDFVFQKMSTGKRRVAHGTLRRDLIPPEFQRKRGRPKHRPDYLVIYYDLDKQNIRSFRDDTLKKIISTPHEPVHSTGEEKEKELKENEKSSKKTKKAKRVKKHKRIRRVDH